MSARLIVAIALTALIGLAMGVEEENQSITIREPSAEELAIRYLEAPYLGETELQKVQLIPGKLPEQMPVQLPLPRGSEIFGSVLLGETEIGVVVDSDFGCGGGHGILPPGFGLPELDGDGCLGHGERIYGMVYRQLLLPGIK